jgi:predicted  nucleic acid-binding Zn-ribbon protein
MGRRGSMMKWFTKQKDNYFLFSEVKDLECEVSRIRHDVTTLKTSAEYRRCPEWEIERLNRVCLAVQNTNQDLRKHITGLEERIAKLENKFNCGNNVNITISDERTTWKGIDITCQK